MYTKKQKVEIHITFLLILFLLELFTILISRKRMIELYKTVESLPWAMPLHWLIPTMTVLYILIAFAGATIWTKRPSQIRNFAMWAWIIQIILNVAWPFCFFYIPIPILTPVVITILFLDLLVLMFYTFLISRIAAYLLIPYCLLLVYKLLFHWVFFILNINLL